MKTGNFGERFERLYSVRGDVAGTTTHDVIIKDKQTGVLYYQVSSRHGSGITPLIDRDGKPLVDE